MPETTARISHMADPLITALATVDAVMGIVCFGSYALGTADAESDVDLYVICDPAIIPEASPIYPVYAYTRERSPAPPVCNARLGQCMGTPSGPRDGRADRL